MNPELSELQQKFAERFKELPEAVQKAITSADIEKRLRSLADTQKLHLDQWQKLENEVMLTLLGFQQIESLEGNIMSEVGVDRASARTLAQNINTIVFEPIRQELERQLEHPEAQEKQLTGAEAAREQLIGAEKENSTPAAPATPAPTPPTPTVEATVARAPASGAYKPGEPSAARKSVVDDPYRETPQ